MRSLKRLMRTRNIYAFAGRYLIGILSTKIYIRNFYSSFSNIQKRSTALYPILINLSFLLSELYVEWRIQTRAHSIINISAGQIIMNYYSMSKMRMTQKLKLSKKLSASLDGMEIIQYSTTRKKSGELRTTYSDFICSMVV